MPESRHPRQARQRAVAAVIAASLTVALAAPASAASSTSIGPSSVTAPYVLPVADGVHIESLLTVGDAGSASDGYEMVGIPDGLGASTQGANLVVYMNQEVGADLGIVRRHGQKGAFVTRLVIDPVTLRVKEGSDLINPGVRYWDYVTGTYVTSGARFADGTLQNPAFARFCSGTLSAPDLFYNAATKAGYKGQFYFANEQNGDPGRSFAVTKDGDAAALPHLGLFSWENTIPAPNASDTTLVIGQEDGPTDGSQLWAYVGTKQRSGEPIAKAGLTNGSDFVIDALNEAVSTDAQWRVAYPKGTPGRVDLAEVAWNASGAAQNVQAKSVGLNLNRIEDGNWDPQHPNDFYFLTTQGGDTTAATTGSRDGGGLWRLRFDDVEQPALGGTLTLLLNGGEDFAVGEARMNKPDNLTIDTHGNLLIQEDPGGNNHLARIIGYRIADGAMAVLARFDPALFSAGADADPNRLTTDEESSGIIDTEANLGAGTFLFDAQVHTAKGLPAGTGPGTVQEFVERGQLLTLKVDDWSSIYPS